MTKHFSFRYEDDDSKYGVVWLHISENRWWWDVPVHVADILCALSRHRLCNSLVPKLYDLSWRHTKHQLDVDVDRASWLKWAAMTGADDPSWWWEDEPR